MENLENTNITPVENNMSSMPPVQPMNNPPVSGGKKASPALIVVAVVVVALVVWWVSSAPNTEQAVVPTPTLTPTAEVVQDDLQMEVNDLDLGDLNSEFKEVDQDLNSL